MRNSFFRKAVFTASAAMTVFASICYATAQVQPVVINDDAGWCWFQEERAVIAAGRLIAGSVAAGSRDISRKGNIEISSVDLKTGAAERFVLHNNLELDDHDAPALLLLPDGRLLAAYSKHNKDKVIYFRSTESGADISKWRPEQVFGFDEPHHDVTYANLLDGEGGRIYDFFRGDDFDPNFLFSDDNGATWKHGGRIIGGPGRPYVKYASNNNGEIHFVCSEQHPRDFDNSLYHGYIRGGRIYDSFGKEIGVPGEKPALHADMTRIFKGDARNVAWPSDFEYAADGKLYVVYSVQKDGAGLPPGLGGADHRYRYAFFDGMQWHDHEIARAGSKLYPGEDDYTGLITINPQAPYTVYFSTNADPATGKPLISKADGKRHYEIFKGVTHDRGATWNLSSVTSDSALDQIRPNVPKATPDHPQSVLIWLRGKLKSYTDYDLEMVMLDPAP